MTIIGIILGILLVLQLGTSIAIYPIVKKAWDRYREDVNERKLNE